MRMTEIPVISNILMLVLHAPIAYLYVFKLKWDFIGLAYALCVSYTLNYLISLILMKYHSEKREAIFFPNM